MINILVGAFVVACLFGVAHLFSINPGVIVITIILMPVFYIIGAFVRSWLA